MKLFSVLCLSLMGSLAVAQIPVPTIPGTSGSFGTKFVCCRPESVSTLGGGGGTVWHVMLRDRALTQIDAKARCGIYRMYWATHSCPADSVGGSGGGPTAPANTSLEVCNLTNTNKIFVAYAYHHNGSWQAHGWRGIERGQGRCSTVQLGQYNGDVYLYAEGDGRQWQGNGARFCVHKTDKFDYPQADTRTCNASWVKRPGFFKHRVGPGHNRFNFLP